MRSGIAELYCSSISPLEALPDCFQTSCTIFLVINDAVQLSMYLLAICIYPLLEKYVFKSFTLF